MGNKSLRPDPFNPFAPFSEQQKSYLKQKFDFLCNQSKFLCVKKISEQLKTSIEQATKILNYIDFEGKGQVDFYEFMCAAASLHQDDEQAEQFLFDLVKYDTQMNRDSFDSFFSIVYKYLKHLQIIKQDYSPEIGQKKFRQYDFNGNGSISIDQFRTMLKNDHHCSLWMQVLGFAEEKKIQKQEKPQNHEIQNDQLQVNYQSGDQAGCASSWIKTAQYMSSGQVIKRTSPPNQTLDINYVYGYRSYDTRSNLKYNINNDVVYHTAGCGIILNKLKNIQKVNTTHNDDITCLDINVKKNIVATGQMGRKPLIVIWDATSAETKCIFKNKLQRSIACIAISPSGKYVAATSMSDNHQIAVYDINQQKLVAFGKGPKSVIFQIKFNQAQDEIICSCAKQVIFAKFFKDKIQLKKGVFGKAPCVPCFSLALNGKSQVIIGMNNGLLTQWKGNSCNKIFKQHKKSITALCQRTQGGIISGDADGIIIIWSQNMSKQKQIDLKKLLGNTKLNHPTIISLYEQYSNILIGTRGGQIIQINKQAAKVLIQGHYDSQLWGLAVNRSKNQFFTGGNDKLLYKWDMEKRKPIDKKKLQSAITCIDISRQGTLAIGLKNGTVYFYDGATLKNISKVCKQKNPDKDMLSVIKFSPDGSKIAIAYTPPLSQVLIYDMSNLTLKPKICRGSPSRINSIDFSKSGQQIMINNTSYEILFYDIRNGSQITSATKFKGQQWSTLTCRFSWASQGIWPPCSDGSDINSVDRSHNKKFLATADDFSTVKIFDYPVTQKSQIYNTYKGHSSHVTSIKWSFDDKFIVSTGGLQKSIIQWLHQTGEQIKYDMENDQEQQEQQESNQQNNKNNQGQDGQGQNNQEDDGQLQVQQDQGDQALAVKAYQGQVKASTPDQYKIPNIKNFSPSQNLNIKHVWGIRNQYIKDRVRNQLKYSANYKSCFFITAAVGVQMNLATKQQSFYQGHADDLISFAISPNRKICATGQMTQNDPKNPKKKIVDVQIWDADTKKIKAKLTGFHQRAIVLLQFSPSGQRILTVGQDDKNSLAVYNWQKSHIQWKSPVCGAKVNAASWKNQMQYVTVGMKHIKFWNGAKGTMGKISGASKWDPMFSAIYWKDKFITGGQSGSIYLWTGNSGTPHKNHIGRVDCFAIDKNGTLYSGDSKGVILSWKQSGSKLVLQKQIYKCPQIQNGILSIDFSPQSNILICTNMSQIQQIKKGKTEIIMTSHHKGQLWAQSWSPDNKRFVTAGDDKTIKIYNAQNYNQEFSYNKINNQIRGIDWQNRQGKYIIVGDYSGKIYLFTNQLQLLSQSETLFSKMKKRQQPFWIQDIKFSPNSQYIVFGAHGGASHLQIYQVKQNKLQLKKAIKNIFSSALLSVDWNQQSNIIAATSQAYQLQFCNLDNKISASSVKKQKWATWSAKFGYQVKQIHQGIDYSNINAICVSPSRRLVVSGGDDQKIRLFNYPVLLPKQNHKQYIGHSSHVCRTRFSNDQQYLLSVGGNDRTIILWQVQGAQKFDQKISNQQNQKQPVQEQYEDEGDYEEISIPKTKQKIQKIQNQAQDDFTLQQDQGDQFMAVKPWIGAIKQPTQQYYKGLGKAPSVNLQLQYAHGYRVKDCRNNLKYVKEGKIAYHTAGLGVLMTTENRKQQFFNLHTDDIISFYKVSKGKQNSILYTGQMGAKPLVYSWDLQGNKIMQFKGAKKGVSAIIANQNYVVAAGLDDNHYLYVWNTQGKLITSEKGGRDVIISMQWISTNQFVSIGIKHYKVWTIDGKSIKGSTGSFGKNCNILCSIVVKSQNIFVGAADGSLQVWKSQSCVQSKKIHKSAVQALWVGQNVLLTGSSDNTIKILNLSNLEQIKTINIQQILKNSVKPSIRALDVYENKILIGTLGSQIYEVMSNQVIDNSTQNSKFKLNSSLMKGHYAPNNVTNQVWGLSLYDQLSYVTCSDDATVRLWSINKKQQINMFSLLFDEKLKKTTIAQKDKNLLDSTKGRCICVSKQKWIVVGCKDGTLKIVDNQFTPIHSSLVNKNKKEISHIKFSPDGTMLAVGDHLGYISVYQWRQGQIKLKHRKIKHTSYIKHFDFSKDGNILHSTCGSYQLLFWNVQTGKQITGGATITRNQQWATWNVTLGWPVQGIFEQFMDGTDINAVDRSNQTFGNKNMKLLASGDDRGHVRILQYPCIIKNSQSVIGKGHSSHVTNVKFNIDDETILSTGGQDQTILQWACHFQA